ncbi:DUF222 domain-containing protein [Microbispora sp. CA-135349]|uniref:HNH endonuclease signature motif containing protein n=1 Tax=Microbispora sp. CA-135349 TaxID=3239953 RepID=UPI003D8D1DB3
MDLFEFDHNRPRHSNSIDDGWWDRLIAGSPFWSSEGSLARDEFPGGHLLSGNPERRGSRSPRSTSVDDSSVNDRSTDAQGDVTTDGCAARGGAVGTRAGSSGAGNSAAGSTRAGEAGADSAFRAGAADAAGPVGDDSGAASAAGSSGAAGSDGAGAAGSGGAGAGSAGSAGSAGAGSVGDAGGGAGRGRGRSSGVRSSWVLVASLRESAQALALAPVPDDAGVCLAEAEDLMFARDRITSALADRVGRVHRAGQARQHGHASTRSWLRTVGGLSVAGAGRLLTLGVQLARLPRVREAFAGGELSVGVVEAICMATEHLTGEQVGLAEPILLELAGRAGPAEVARAGRYLRAVLDPDGDERDERADYGRRFLRVRPGRGGGLEGEFYLPREAAARLRALLDAYARPRAEGDDRPLRVRQADALIALLEQKIVAELLVLVNAESLPTDPVTDPATDTAPDPATDPSNDPVPDQGGQRDQDDDANHPGDPTTTDTAPDPATDPVNDPAQGDQGDDVNHPGGATDAGDTEDVGASDTEDIENPEDTGTSDAAGLDGSDDVSDANDAYGVGGGDAVGATGRGDDLCNRIQPTEPTESIRRAEAVCPVPGEAEGTDAVAPGPGAAGHGDAAGYAQPEGKDAKGTQSEGTRSRKPQQREPQQCEPQSRKSRWDDWQRPDPPPGDTAARHAHPGPRPAGESRHGLGTPEDHRDGRDTDPGPGARALFGTALGTALGTVPGLLLATGQMLPVSGVHRLARTSALVRLVMNADGQVLDMGRKVRLATPAQRRAVFARYATCWIDGCPLPATMCQIDHADNWSTGGLTDLKLLGPACQFHNRDRYQHPERYTRRTTGKDRWAFTYHHPARAPRRRQ